MITLESASIHPIHGYNDAPITFWPVGELWDIPNLLEAGNLGQVVLPQPTRIPVEERARSIEQELRLRFQQQAEKAAEQWKPIYWQAVAQQQAAASQEEQARRAAEVQRAHEIKMAEMAAQLQQREAEARQREQLLATQQELSLLRQAQRAVQAEESLIAAQERREQAQEMRRRAPQTPALPPVTRPETPAVTIPITPMRPVTPAALTPPGTPPVTPAAGRISQPQIVQAPAPVVAPREQRITGGLPVPVRAAAPAAMPARATLDAAYQIQLSRMYPSAGDMEIARQMQVAAAQLSDLGQARRIYPSRMYQPRRQPNPYVRQWRASQHIPRRTTPTPTTRQRTPVFQPMTRRASVSRRSAARPRTGYTLATRRAVSRPSPAIPAYRSMMTALRASASRQRRSR